MGIIRKELYNDTQNTLAQVFGILSHPCRMNIILMLVVNDSLALGEIRDQIGLSQSATSEQVKQLKDVGLITGTQVGTSVRYNLNREMWESIKVVIQYFLNEVNIP